MLKKYALFDFDDTLIRGDSIVRMCLFVFRRGMVSPAALLKMGVLSAMYLCGFTTAVRAKEAAMQFLTGKTETEVEALAEEFCEKVLVPKLYRDGVKELKARAEDGCEVWLISASPAFYLQPLQKHLPITGVIGTRMHVLNGMYTGQMAGENCRGVEKPLRLAEVLASRGDMLDYGESSAYGDSAGDAPMLALCARKVAVNPRKKLLRELEGVEGVEKVRWR